MAALTFYYDFSLLKCNFRKEISLQHNQFSAKQEKSCLGSQAANHTIFIA